MRLCLGCVCCWPMIDDRTHLPARQGLSLHAHAPSLCCKASKLLLLISRLVLAHAWFVERSPAANNHTYVWRDSLYNAVRSRWVCVCLLGVHVQYCFACALCIRASCPSVSRHACLHTQAFITAFIQTYDHANFTTK